MSIGSCLFRSISPVLTVLTATRTTYMKMMMDVERVLRTRDGALTSTLTCLAPAKSLHPIGASANSLN